MCNKEFLKQLEEIKKRIDSGWRLQHDLQWLVRTIEEQIYKDMEKENASKS